ncbi:MAG: 2-hydroxyacyl-CoA dehydratase [Promethearchaeota archaeon]|nr:MAG: 2-hydroxyacyl-CoA dehydratase [Candidatus Lokiarchaeota archaeon]
MESLELLMEFNEYLRGQKISGKKIIAYISHDNIPEELIDAAGFFPLQLQFAGEDELMHRSHNYLPPSTCSFAQSCIGMFDLKPSKFRFLNEVDYIILSNHCVSDICASEIISKYCNVKRIDFYVPYTNNKSAIDYLKLELNNLREELEKIRGENIPDSSILESIIKFNNFKKKLAEVNSLAIKGSTKLKILQKAMLYGPYMLTELENFIEDHKNSTFKDKNSVKNVILTGCAIFIGDYLIDLIEEGGGNILFYDSWIGFNYFSQTYEKETLDSYNNPMDLFTLRFKKNKYADHCIPEHMDNRLTHIENLYNNFKEKTGSEVGVINHVIKFCDHMGLSSHKFKDKLQERGIKVLNLERDYSKANRGQLSTRIEAYMEMI